MRQNAINVIKPYKWNGMWVFDDDTVDLVKEPFVAGADTMIDRAVELKGIQNADDGFLLIFSESQFPIIVTDDLVEPIHDRMPVILEPEDFDLWLDREFEGKEKLQELLRPCPSEELEAYPVKTIVNNPRNDLEQCIQRVDEE